MLDGDGDNILTPNEVQRAYYIIANMQGFGDNPARMYFLYADR